MAADPILVLQMQRMGDLILSFPLFLWLARQYPGHPLAVVAEEPFFRPLLPLSPPAEYVSWPQASAGALAGRRFRLIANLSIREEAARLAGELEAPEKIGPVREAGGALRVRGAWQLYRAGLVNQGRHNRFHWAELNALDLVPLPLMARTAFDPPRSPGAGGRAVGLFLGASEAGKRPDAEFYAGLAQALLKRGLRPALLGGPGERPLAEAVRAACRQPLVDLAGRLSLADLAEYLRGLALFVTPDTGPMHLAAWVGAPTLNLSVGHVSPWDTGPYQPGQLVLRSTASCAGGCWSCRRAAPLCRAGLAPQAVAALAARVIEGPAERLSRVKLPGQALYATGRGPEGLYGLRRLDAHAPAAAELAGEFWRRFFLWRLAGLPEEGVREAWTALSAAWPRLGARLPAALPGLGRAVGRMARGLGGPSLSAGLPPFWRPLATHLEVEGQNRDASPAWARDSLDLLEGLAGLLPRS